MAETTPVADHIIPPNPQQGLQTLSNILGIRQQRQQLQTGQYTQESALAAAQQAQISARAQTDASNFFKTVDFHDHIASDGTTDIASMLDDPAMKGLSGAGRELVMNRLQDLKQKQITTARGLMDMGKDGLDLTAKIVGSVMTDPDVVQGNQDGKDKFTAALQNAINIGGPPVAKALTPYMKMTDGPLKPGDLPKRAKALLLAGMSAENSLSAQSASPQFVQQQGGMTPVNVNPNAATPVGSPMGQTVPNATPPGTYVNALGQTKYLPPGGAAGGQRSAGGGGPNAGLGPNPSKIDVARYEAITNRVQQAQAAANNTVQAQDALGRALTILRDPNAPQTGAGAGGWLKTLKNAMSTAGVDTEGAENINTLVKNLARYEAARATQAGLGGTDAARDLAHNGSPSVQLDNKALKGIVMQSMATEQAMASYAKKQSITRDPEQQIANEAAFRSIPHMIEGYEYLQAKSKEEANDILRKSGLRGPEMKAVIQKIRAFEAQ